MIARLLLILILAAAQGAAADSGYAHPEDVLQVLESPTLDVLTLNVAHGRGAALNQLLVSKRAHRANLDQVATLLAQSGAQVVALQEADGPSIWSGGFSHVEYLAAATDLSSWVHGIHARWLPYAYGTALMSRVRLREIESMAFSPSWPTATKGFVIAQLAWRSPQWDSPAQRVTVVSVHLDFSREKVRRAQMRELVSRLALVDTPLVLMGDFNADWDGDQSPLRLLTSELGLVAYRPEQEGLGTYKGDKRLDWILLSNQLVFKQYAVLPQNVSDHRAVYARIAMKDENLP